MPGAHRALMDGLVKLLHEDSRIRLFPHIQPPDPSAARHVSKMIELTSRRFTSNRARRADGPHQ
eukprot:10939730-Karenia_brevis.AAC.1